MGCPGTDAVGRPRSGRALRRLAGAVLTAALVLALPPAPAPAASASGDDTLYLVTLDGPGLAGYRGALPHREYRARLRDR